MASRATAVIERIGLATYKIVWKGVAGSAESNRLYASREAAERMVRSCGSEIEIEYRELPAQRLT
jgi:hypothetical protein